MTSFGPLKVIRGQAQKRVTEQFGDAWRKGLKLDAELVWVPYDRVLTCLASGEEYETLPQPSADHSTETSPKEGRLIEAQEEVYLYVPYWRFFGGDGYAFVDATTKDIVSAKLPADPTRAAARFALILLFMIFTAWWGAYFVGEIVYIFGAVFGILGPTPGVLVALPAAVIYAKWIAKVCAGGLVEPLERATNLTIQAGSLPGLARSLKIGGRLVLCIIPILATNLARPNRVFQALILLGMVIAILFGRSTHRLAQQMESQKGKFVPAPLSDHLNRPSQLVQFILRFILGGTFVVIAWTVAAKLDAPGLWGWTPRPQANVIESYLITVALVGALALSPAIAGAKRWSLIVGIATGQIAKGLGGDIAEMAVPLVTVAAAAYPLLRRQADSTKEAAKAALQITWRFNLAAAVGRLVGRLLGGVLLGTSGIVLGESLGELVLAILAVDSEKAPASKGNAPPVQAAP